MESQWDSTKNTEVQTSSSSPPHTCMNAVPHLTISMIMSLIEISMQTMLYLAVLFSWCDTSGYVVKYSVIVKQMFRLSINLDHESDKADHGL